MNIFARRKTRFQYILPGDYSPGEKPDSSILSRANNHIYSPGRIAGFQYILPGEYSPGEKPDSSIFSRANIRPAKKTDSSIFSRAIIHQAKNQIPVYSPGRILPGEKPDSFKESCFRPYNVVLAWFELHWTYNS